jgi:hypothetical protein
MVRAPAHLSARHTFPADGVSDFSVGGRSATSFVNAMTRRFGSELSIASIPI